jgi:hypothetical protein
MIYFKDRLGKTTDKMKLFLAAVLSLIFFSAYSQNVVIERNGKVVIRKDNGAYVSTVESSGVIEAFLNSSGTEVVLTYDDGKVIVKKTNGMYVSTVENYNAKSARWSEDNIVIFYRNGKIIKRKKNGHYISTINNR